MQSDHNFWLPVHEAGHVVVAMALGIEPCYAILKISPEITRAYTILPYPRASADHDEVRFVCAGMAAEILTFRSAERDVPEEEFMIACFDRSQDDRQRLFTMINANDTGAVDDESQKTLILNLITRNVIPIIERNALQFMLVRSHLAQHKFIARASLRRIAQGLIPSDEDIKTDHAQLPPDDPAWEVPPPDEQT